MERMTIDVPEDTSAQSPSCSRAQGLMETMANHGTGWSGWSSRSRRAADRVPHAVPHRHARHRHRVVDRRGSRAWAGPIETRINGSLVADRSGVVTPFAMVNLQERGSFFVDPTQVVYEGMIVGENSRNEDMDINITKEKKLTNMRAAASDTFENLTPPRHLTLEESLEFARRGRVRRGHAGRRSPAQGHPRPERARSGLRSRQARLTHHGGLLAVHAHPDDETLATGGLLATWARAGRPVTVVTCTRGELGEVIGGELAHLAGDGPALAAHRETELAGALGALGVADHVFLDTVAPPARFVDSGMAWAGAGRAGRVAHLPDDAFVASAWTTPRAGSPGAARPPAGRRGHLRARRRLRAPRPHQGA